jgi:hypothetical protein
MALIKIKQVDGLTGDLSTLTSADSSLTTRVSTEESVRASADGSIDTRVSTAESDIDVLEGDVNSIDTRVSTEESVRLAADNSLDSRVDTIESTIIEDNEFIVEKVTGANIPAGGLSGYTLTSGAVQDNETELVWAYVNGQSVEVASVSGGNSINLVDPGYTIDGDDEVKFHYQAG